MEKSFSSRDKLSEKIKALEQQNALKMAELNNRVKEFKHSMAPAALISSAYNGIRQNKQVQGNLLDRSAGLAAGWVVRKLFARTAGGMLTKLSGYALQFVATKFITKKMPAIRDKVHLQGFTK